MPKLYGAPAYARPPQPMVPTRPFDPDDLPLEAYRADDEPSVNGGSAGHLIDVRQDGSDGSAGATSTTADQDEPQRARRLGRMLGGGRG
jgi:hypothetical protein